MMKKKWAGIKQKGAGIKKKVGWNQIFWAGINFFNGNQSF